MIVHHSDCLHKGVADGRANESEPAFLKIFAHRVGLLGTSEDLIELS